MTDVQGLAPATDSPEKVSYVQLVPAVGQANRILFALAHEWNGAVSLTEICLTVGINKSKGLAILNTLRNAGLVTRSERSKTYRLGPGLLTLSRALLDHTDLAQISSPFLDRLAVSTGCTALMGLVSGDRVFVVARREAPIAMGIAVHVGHRFPLTWGAHGKAILAALPEEERERILAEGPVFVHGRDGDPVLDLEALRAELDECRRAGYGHDLGVTRPGVNAVSAALVDELSGTSRFGSSRVVGCLVVVGTFPLDSVEEYGTRVAATAREMSPHLGSLL